MKEMTTSLSICLIKKNKMFSIVIVIFHLFICQVAIGQGVIGQFNKQ